MSRLASGREGLARAAPRPLRIVALQHRVPIARPSLGGGGRPRTSSSRSGGRPARSTRPGGPSAPGPCGSRISASSTSFDGDPVAPRVEADPDGLVTSGACPSRGPDPGEAAWLNDRRAIVRAAIETLPPPQRQAMNMAVLEDLTHQQISEILEPSPRHHQEPDQGRPPDAPRAPLFQGRRGIGRRCPADGRVPPRADDAVGHRSTATPPSAWRPPATSSRSAC